MGEEIALGTRPQQVPRARSDLRKAKAIHQNGRPAPFMPLLNRLLIFLLCASSLQAFNPQDYLRGSGFQARRDSMMTYEADTLFMNMATHTTHLAGEASIEFTGMSLESPRIRLNWEKQRVLAWVQKSADAACGGRLGLGPGQSLSSEKSRPSGRSYAADPSEISSFPSPSSSESDSTRSSASSHADSLFQAPDSLQLQAKLETWPVFRDATQELFGRSLSLNLKTQQGRILDGRIGQDGSFYGGTRIKRVNPAEMHVQNAVFTSCDEGCPHYHFEAGQLKMLLKDRVLAKDVFLCFGKVRTLYSPMALFSLKKGRASGILLPSFGNTASKGRSLDHLGFYWAAAETWDTRFKMSYAENGPDWLFQNLSIYRFDRANSGRISGSYNISETTQKRGWDLRWNHRQSLTPYISVKADMRLASSKSFYDNSSDNITTRLTSALNSSFSLSGRFPEQRINWSLSSRANQNLETESMSGVLPAFSLNLPTVNPLSFLAEKKGEKRASPLSTWLAGTVLQASSQAENRFSMQDWAYGDGEKRSGMQHRVGLSIPGNLGPLKLTPRINLQEQWVNRELLFYENTRGFVDTLRVGGLSARHLFGASMGFSTKLYGIARPNWGSLLALRHVFTPTLRLNWSPDFSKPGWGYVNEIEVPGSSEVEGSPFTNAPETLHLDRFAESIYGSTPESDRLSLSIRVDQLFQGKWKKKASPDSLKSDDPFGPADETVTRQDLLGLSSSTAYDFLKTSFRLADLSTTWRLAPLKSISRIGPFSGLNVNLRTVHTPYQTDSTGARVDRYLWQDASKRLPRLTQTRLSLSTRLSGKNFSKKSRSSDSELPTENLDRFAPDFGSSDLSVPWDMNLSWSWSRNSSNPLAPTRRHYMNASASIRLSQRWKISTGMHYDFIDRSFASNSLKIYRDMHCWEGFFTWNPRGANPSYHLLIKVKSSFLQDLKWDKRKGRSGTVSTF
jgi:hypothetical protein